MHNKILPQNINGIHLTMKSILMLLIILKIELIPKANFDQFSTSPNSFYFSQSILPQVP